VASQDPQPDKDSGGWSRQFAMATDLPFVLVGAVLVGGAIGFYLDRWLHTKPYLMLGLGTAGFIVGVRDVLRRVSKN
jgi:ATP synthase protein I